MYDAKDIAAYVLNHCISKGEAISNLALQKILYYLQAAFLFERGSSLFTQEIAAWKYGPVVEEVYHDYKVFVDSKITKKIDKSEELIYENGEWVLSYHSYDPNEKIDEDDQELINSVVDAKAKYHPLSLVRETHKEDPWKEAISKGTYITVESIERYFANNRDRIWS